MIYYLLCEKGKNKGVSLSGLLMLYSRTMKKVLAVGTVLLVCCLVLYLLFFRPSATQVTGRVIVDQPVVSTTTTSAKNGLVGLDLNGQVTA